MTAPHQATELAWCAGFFDAEGIALRYLDRLILQVSHPVVAPLNRLRHNLNGHVHGPYFERSRPCPDSHEAAHYWVWQATGETAQAAAMVLAPLSTCKREALQRLF